MGEVKEKDGEGDGDTERGTGWRVLYNLARAAEHCEDEIEVSKGLCC